MNLKENIPLSSLSFFRIGGAADFVAEPATKEELREALAFAQEQNLPYYFLGSGSNVLFADAGFRGLIIKTANTGISSLDQGEFEAGAGVLNISLYRFAKEHGRDFSAFFTIPGTLGGAVAGNAGIPAAEIKDYLISAEVFDTKQLRFQRKGMDFFHFRYRHTIFHDDAEARKRYFIWPVTLLLPELSAEEIEHKSQEYLAMRKAKQPWGKTGGSFFMNPPEGAAGYFLEQAGAKEMREGGAFFSDKHANFLMSDGTAIQADIIKLARRAIAAVKSQFNIDLVTEVILLDEEGSEVVL